MRLGGAGAAIAEVAKFGDHVCAGAEFQARGLQQVEAIAERRSAIVDALTIVLALASAVLLIRYKVNSAWLVLGGGIAGIAWKSLV